MICGVDVYHAPAGQKTKGSVAAFVASLDKPLTSWYSRICLQRPNQELVDLLKVCLVASIKAYAKVRKLIPTILLTPAADTRQFHVVEKRMLSSKDHLVS